MRLACLQFAPQVGDTDNNISRADAVLSKANPDELDHLDLLVLPELAFTGYNFKSLENIGPYLENAKSGISCLWARTIALDHRCTVVVGYPEKVDAECPASSEYYNSALVVDGNGDTVGNYRKSFLHFSDETWAHQSSEGFFRGELPELGNVGLDISTDINPHRFEVPRDAFEFGIHLLEAQANVVILTMAWHHRDPSLLDRNSQEPDVETLVYWVRRLEPRIRVDREGEVIVAFCNRTGAEEEAIYTGTSAVIGIKQGEVFVYGILGHGAVDLLIVDTDRPPRYKLTDVDDVKADKAADDFFEKEEEPCQLTLADGRVGSVTDDAICIPRCPDTSRLGRRPPRPKLAIPMSFPPSLSPHPWHVMTPITPFEEDGWIPTPIGPKPPRWVSQHEETLFTLPEEDSSM